MNHPIIAILEVEDKNWMNESHFTQTSNQNSISETVRHSKGDATTTLYPLRMRSRCHFLLNLNLLGAKIHHMDPIDIQSVMLETNYTPQNLTCPLKTCGWKRILIPFDITPFYKGRFIGFPGAVHCPVSRILG